MSDHPSAISGAFGQPFPEQVAFFRQKLGNLVPTQFWDDMLREEHDRGFMVAGAMKADLLADLAAAVDKAIAEGRGIEEFRKDFRAIVAKHGWTGWTGEGSTGGEAWRVKTILRTNAYTSYSAGRFAQLTAGKFAFWVYRHGGSLEPRPTHLSWNGVALRPDHPFWPTHYPPSDWGCSCYVVGADTAAGVRRLRGDPDKKLPANWQSINPKTGEPVGIGKGWGYAPGASVAKTVTALAAKLEKLPLPIAVALSREWLESLAFQKWAEKPSGNWPLAVLADEDAALIGSEVRVAQLSPDTIAKQKLKHPELDWSEYRAAQDVIDQPTFKLKDTDKSLVFVRVIDDAEATGGYVLVVKATSTGKGLFVTSYRRLSRDEAARDDEIARLLRKAER